MQLKKIEVVVDKIIPLLLVILLFVIIAELLFKEEINNYIVYIDIFDMFLIIIFSVDLMFKYSRTRKMKFFFKRYWLEIIAIFPFFLIFRLYEGFALFFGNLWEFVLPSQKIIHEGLVVEKIVAEDSRMVKIIRPLMRIFKFGELKDVYEGGAIRNSRAGKGRYDLIPTKALIRLARVYEVGGIAHGDRNWEKGIPTDRLVDSAMRHIVQYWDGMMRE